MIRSRNVSETPTIDPQVLDGVRRALRDHGLHGATLERIAEAAGLSRMTLHRRGLSRERLLAALAIDVRAAYRQALWPALTAKGTGRERLELALRGECDVVDSHVEVLEALDEPTHGRVFHEPGSSGLTHPDLVEPIERILLDGVADGTLRDLPPAETATLLLNLVGHTYRHLRRQHGWTAARARERILDVALRGVEAR